MTIKAQVDEDFYGKDIAIRSWEACPHAKATLTRTMHEPPAATVDVAVLLSEL